MRTVKRTLTPAKAIAILKEYGTIITLEEAEIMLDFIYEFAKIAIDQQLQPSPGHPDLIRFVNDVRK